MKNDYTNLVSKNLIEASLAIANAHIQNTNPSLWDGNGEKPEDFDARIGTYQVTQYAELDISFEQNENGDWVSVYGLRESATQELMDVTHEYSINDAQRIATIIACIIYDNIPNFFFQSVQTETFDLRGFMVYMEQKFSCMTSPFLRTMIENVVEYAVKMKGHTKDGIAYLLEDLIPEIEFGEAAMFTNRSLLTSYGQHMATLARIEWEVSKCQSNT